MKNIGGKGSFFVYPGKARTIYGKNVHRKRKTNIKWRAYGIYGYYTHNDKGLTCDMIKDLTNNNNYTGSWLIFVDSI